jgi:WD40 repeat protein
LGREQNDTAWSSDGETLAVGGSLGIWIYDMENFDLIRFIEHPNVKRLAFNTMGSILVSLSAYEMRFWHMSDGALLQTEEINLPSSHPISVVISPDGRNLALGWYYGVSLYRLSDMTVLYSIGHSEVVRDVIFSPDGSKLVTESDVVRLWRASDGQLLETLGEYSSISISPDGSILALGSSDGPVELRRVNDGTLLDILIGHTDIVNSMTFSKDGSTLATGSWDGIVRLWRVSDGSELEVLEGHTNWIDGLSFNSDGSTIASSAYNDPVYQWRVRDGALLKTLQGHIPWVRCIAFNPDGSLLASGHIDGNIRLWQVMDDIFKKSQKGVEGEILSSSWTSSIAFSPDGNTIASGGLLNSINLYQVNKVSKRRRRYIWWRLSG